MRPRYEALKQRARQNLQDGADAHSLCRLSQQGLWCLKRLLSGSTERTCLRSGLFDLVFTGISYVV